MSASTKQTWLNPEIQLGREAGLAALKPTPAQLERGLELHAQATVVDTYGFSIFASPDNQRFIDAMEKDLSPLARKQIYVDTIMTRMAEDDEQRRYFHEAWQAAGVTCVIRNSGEEGNRPLRMIERLAHNTYVTDRLEGIMARATKADHIRQAKAKNQHCFIYTTNGVPLSLMDEDKYDELRYIRIFRQLGVRMMHMTYNRQNILGGGCGETNNMGLSDLGRDAVAEMNKQGVIVDVAHSSWQVALDAARCTTRPIVVSHAACAAVNMHCRGKSDEVIRAVASTGGLMGIAAIPAFLGHSGDINALLDHIDHVVKVAGVDHVAIGTDNSTPLPASAGDPQRPANYLSAMPKHLQSHWPVNDALYDPHWNQESMIRSLTWTNWPLYTVGLVMRGYSDSDILKIIGGNTLRVLASADE